MADNGLLLSKCFDYIQYIGISWSRKTKLVLERREKVTEDVEMADNGFTIEDLLPHDEGLNVPLVFQLNIGCRQHNSSILKTLHQPIL